MVLPEGSVAPVAALRSPDTALGRDKTMEQGQEAACGCSGVCFQAGAQSEWFSPFLLLQFALWRSQLSSGSSAQTLVLSFSQKINPSTNQRIIPGSAHCCSLKLGEAALLSPWRLSPSPGCSSPGHSSALGTQIPLSWHPSISPTQGPKAAQKAAPNEVLLPL